MSKVWTTCCLVVLIAQMSAAQKKTAIVDSWIAAWNSHDAEKAIAIFTPTSCLRRLRSEPPTTDLQSWASSLYLS